MAKPKLSDWLRQRVSRQSKLCLLSPLALIPAAALATVITGWAVYYALLIGLGAVLGLGGQSLNYVTWCVLGVLYLWQFTIGRSHREEWHFSGKGTGTADVAIRVITDSPFAAFALDPAAGMMFVRLLATLLLSGPRLCVLAWDLLKRGMRLQSMNVPICAAVLAKLMKQQTRVSMDELLKDMPLQDLKLALPQLADVDGVVFLSSNPIGLTVAPRLHKEIDDWVKNSTAGN